MGVEFAAEIQQFLETGRDFYPQPVATACGQVLRARTHESLLEATLKAAEVLARYLGALALTSYACRKSDPPSIPFEADRFQKHLAFGDFLELTQSIAISDCDHPLRQQFQAMDSRNKKPARIERTASAALGKLLEFRNDRGHELTGLNSAQALSFLTKNQVLETLIKAIACEPQDASQHWRRGNRRRRRTGVGNRDYRERSLGQLALLYSRPAGDDDVHGHPSSGVILAGD